MRDLPINAAPASPAVDVRAREGIDRALDEAAESADPRHAFLRAAWFRAGAGDAATTLVAYRSDGRVIAALPTAPSGPRLLGLRSVTGSYWPFRSFPVAADASDAEIAAFLFAPASLRTLGRAWRMGPVMADDPTLARLGRAARRAGWSMLQGPAGTAFSLDMSGEEEEGSWPRPSTLKNIAKQEKRLGKLGALGWRHVAGDGWTPAAFDDLAAIERNSWVATRPGSDPKFLDERRREGWEAALADPKIAELVTAGILTIEGEPVSFSFGIDAGPVRYSIATSYDERFARHSPGYVTGYRTYIDAVERGVRVLNLGSGDGGAKSSMGATPGPELVECLFVRGRLLGALLAPAWKRFLR